ncbi:hypothetical protein H310_15177 [Aphanomyces invadans]|uniref:Uncharacterized protein n=1 Tax=Aphanomyces invadans TaxID=157072 RepID=A0A024T7Y3_9STRA|nr:hypothetical protein H310_15177 [Aphanomyces invadans]ETV89979.1 hypothetical protein H310_15177 [Aphanomyces invadans]|eukprot:XP_008881385.1 hypothetical protein H310_15177 [Aphanomyces invadans]
MTPEMSLRLEETRYQHLNLNDQSNSLWEAVHSKASPCRTLDVQQRHQ